MGSVKTLFLLKSTKRYDEQDLTALSCMIMKRTQIEDFEKIEKAEDLEKVVRDKRKGKRASKEKAKRRNRHYQKTLLKHLSQKHDQDEA